MKTITRKQLIQLGASKYQARLVTKPLMPIKKQRNTNIYDLFIVSDRCRELIDNTHLRLATLNAIKSLRWSILEFAETLNDAPFGMSILERINCAETLEAQVNNLTKQADELEKQIKKKRKPLQI